MVRGSTPTFNITVKSGGIAVDLTGATVWLTMKTQKGDGDGAALLQISAIHPAIALSRVNWTNAAGGLYSISLKADDTAAFVDDIEVFYDFQVQTAGGSKHNPLKGKMFVEADITRA